MKKKVIVISNFHEDAMVSRSNIAYKYFKDRNFTPVVLYSNFSHSLKEFRYIKEPDFIALNTIKYNSNISFKRIVSHLIFTFRVYHYLIKNKTDYIYINLPPNTLALAILFLKRRNEVKIILDIIDLWPESIPHSNRIKQSLVYIIGVFPKYIRKKAIANCDYCLTESDFFYEKLELNRKEKSKTIYLKKFQTEKPDTAKLTDSLSIVYLGNIGNIYNFESLFKIITELEKTRPVILHVIGSGPLSNWFFNKIDILKINYEYHGASFDENLKKEILPKCWFGFNGYKQDTEVALSYKSIDYLSYGVPLINSAKEDTSKLVNSENIGYNFDEKNLNGLIAQLSTISKNEIIQMKEKAYLTFQKKFSGQSYYEEMDSVLNQL